MIYEYECKDHGTFDVVKHHSESESIEYCVKCKGKMKKLISRGASISYFKEEFYHAFNKPMSSRGQVKEEIRRIKGETGKEIEEIGDYEFKKKPKRKRITETELKEAYKDLKGAMHG